jgi:hypothetical protein
MDAVRHGTFRLDIRGKNCSDRRVENQPMNVYSTQITVHNLKTNQ